MKLELTGDYDSCQDLREACAYGEVSVVPGPSTGLALAEEARSLRTSLEGARREIERLRSARRGEGSQQRDRTDRGSPRLGLAGAACPGIGDEVQLAERADPSPEGRAEGSRAVREPGDPRGRVASLFLLHSEKRRVSFFPGRESDRAGREDPAERSSEMKNEKRQGKKQGAVEGEDTVRMSRDELDEALAHCAAASERAMRVSSSLKIKAAKKDGSK